jgi:hypothetical protein
MSRWFFSLVLPAVLIAASSGCQRGEEFIFAPVSGTVTRNGVPLSGVRVIFYADPDAGTHGPRAIGRTNAQGQYHLHSDAGDDGAVLGRHRVCVLESADFARFVQQRYEKDPAKIEKLAGKVAGPGLSTAGSATRLPSDCSSIADTPLRADVHPGPQTIDLVVP